MKQKKYSSVESPYIRSRIASTPFQDRKVIDDLIRLHKWIRCEPTTASSARAYGALRRRHHEAWLALLREYSEAEYAAWIADHERAEREEQERLEREARQEEVREQAELEDWITAGGLPPNPDPEG